jgi:hypothetical protein
MPMILDGLHGIRAVGTASFRVLISPPSSGLVGRAIGHCSFCSKTPSGTRAHIRAFAESSSVTALLERGTCCRSEDLKILLQLLHMKQVGGQLCVMVAALFFDLLDD